jgi:hypothetical protein
MKKLSIASILLTLAVPLAAQSVSFNSSDVAAGQSWTEDGALRAPVFLRLRDDIDPKTVRRAGAPPARPAAEAEGAIADIVAQLASPKTAFTLVVGAQRIGQSGELIGKTRESLVSLGISPPWASRAWAG